MWQAWGLYLPSQIIVHWRLENTELLQGCVRLSLSLVRKNLFPAHFPLGSVARYIKSIGFFFFLTCSDQHPHFVLSTPTGKGILHLHLPRFHSWDTIPNLPPSEKPQSVILQWNSEFSLPSPGFQMVIVALRLGSSKLDSLKALHQGQPHETVSWWPNLG